MIEFGMPTLIENRTLQDNIGLCRDLGLRFIELNMNFPEYQVDRLEQTERFCRAAEEAGIYYTVHLDETLNVADFNPLVSEAYRETVRRSVKAARKLLYLKERFGGGSGPVILNMVDSQLAPETWLHSSSEEWIWLMAETTVRMPIIRYLIR